MIKSIMRTLAHLLLGIRRFNNKCIKNYAVGVYNKRILEIGSGKNDHGKDYYSAKKYFHSSNDFIQSDINPLYGYKVVDITEMKFHEEFDVIICMNVLEHVYDYKTAIENLHKAIKPGGELVVFVPMFYPLHDEPHDYWRFTRYALKNIFKKFKTIDFQNSGLKQFPIAYFMILQKNI